MRLKYDLHIHTALSPCALNDMTPNNIVNMAVLNELDVISITDHNSCKNIASVIKAAEGKSIRVIPGIEVETREEIHVLCYFSESDNVYNMQSIIYNNLPELKNKPKIFGEQYIFDEFDNIIGVEDKFLLTATKLSINEVFNKVTELGGIMIPAHIDRPSYSIISNLGMIPQDLLVTVLEVSRHADLKKYKEMYSNYLVTQSSDSHELGYIGINENFLEVPNRDIKSIINVLNVNY